MIRFKSIYALVFLWTVTGLANGKQTCSKHEAKKIEGEVVAAIEAITPIYKKDRGALTQEDMNLVYSKARAVNKTEYHACLRTDPQLFKLALKAGGMICFLDDYKSNLEFLLELSKSKEFSSVLKRQGGRSAACVEAYLKAKKLEDEYGSG